MTLIISPRAARRLREIQGHIALEASLHIALRVILRIRQSVEMLTDFSEIGARWQDGPTRVLVVSGLPYRVHYQIKGDVVEVLTIAHTSQRPPRFGWPACGEGSHRCQPVLPDRLPEGWPKASQAGERY